MILRRAIFDEIKRYLFREETVLIVGPRQVGKTVLLHQIESFLKSTNKTCFFLNLEDPDYLRLLNETPKNLFKIFPFNSEANSYLFIDEVQYLANPANFLKYFFDQYHGKIKIIASGSSAFYLDRKFTDSLAGRKKIFTLYTLSFREFLTFKNEPVLARANFSILKISEKELIEGYYLEYLMYGGYPRVVLSSLSEKKEVLHDLVYSYIKKDIYESNIRQDEIFYKLMKILSHQVGSLVNSNELAKTLGISKTAVDNYLYVMQKSFHITFIRPFYKNIRKELIKMPKAYFNDLGLWNFLKNDFRPLVDRDDSGQLLENAVFRHLLDKHDVYSIKFWRTVGGREVDFVIDEKNLAFEVKLQISKAKLSNYNIFREAYPNINFKFISFEDALKMSD